MAPRMPECQCCAEGWHSTSQFPVQVATHHLLDPSSIPVPQEATDSPSAGPAGPLGVCATLNPAYQVGDTLGTSLTE